MAKYQIDPAMNNQDEGMQWILKIDCANCTSSSNPIECVSCVMLGLIKNGKKEIREINIDEIIHLDEEELLVLDFLKHLFLKLDKIYMKKKYSCSKLENGCNSENYYLQLFNEFNPSGFLKIILNHFEILETKENYNYCDQCIKKTKENLEKSKNIYITSKIYQYFKQQYGIRTITRLFFLNLFPSLKNKSKKINSMDLFKNFKILSEYTFFKKTYSGKIYSDKEGLNYYNPTKNLIDNIRKKVKIIQDFLKNKINDIDLQYFDNFNIKLKKICEKSEFLIHVYFPDIKYEERIKIAYIISSKFLNIEKIFPLLLDPFIEEIFLDSLDNYIYINHQKFGRCNTLIGLNKNDIEAIKTHLRLESKRRLDENLPSLIYVMNNDFFHCRFSIDISPSHWKDVAIDIRKMNKNIFTMFDLINLNTLNLEMACFLVICILMRVNITIAGEVNSGKTTLLNSIDLFAPKQYRKIYVEEMIETIEFPIENGHQLKYIVEPEIDGQNNNKEREIYKLLHRSGDLIILGEILSKHETNALFHCLSAGLRGLQTTHASTLSGLLNRWIIHYGVDKNCLNDLGVIILMKKIGLDRIILSISEVNYNDKSNKIEKNTFFEFDPQKNDFIPKFPLDKSMIFQNLNKFIEFREQDYQKLVNVLIKMFNQRLISKDRVVFSPLEEILPELKKIVRNIGVV
jgi:archaeal flagellar protein FlaI